MANFLSQGTKLDLLKYLFKTESDKHASSIRADLDSRSDLSERPSLFVYLDVQASGE
jgi:hypothetical protein